MSHFFLIRSRYFTTFYIVSMFLFQNIASLTKISETMKKSLLFIFILSCCIVQQIFAQLEVTGSDEYGRIYDITYDAQVENKLYAITLGNHLLQSVDNGVTWNILYSFPEKGASLKSLKALPGNQVSFYTTYGMTDKVIVLDLNTLSIIKEYVLPIPEGAEDTWIQAYSIFESDTDTALVLQGFSIGMANYAKVYYTTDGGKTWQEVYYNENYDQVFPNNVAISPADPAKLFIMRGLGPNDVDGGLFVSEDAGTTWTEKIPGNAYQTMTFNPANPDDILLGTSIGFGTGVENLYRSLDGGTTWNVIPITWTDMTLNNINAIVYNPSDLNNIIVLDENEIVITHDNFATVENYVYPGTDTHSYYYGLNASFNPFNGSEIFINSDFYPLFSTDGGVTVTQAKNPYFATTGNIDIAVSTEAHLYYGVQFGYVHRDLATGIDTPYDVKPIDYMSIDPGMTVYADNLIPGRVYTMTSSFMGKDLHVSNDHGATSFIVYNTFASTFHTAVSDPSNPNVIFASFSSWGSSPEVDRIDFTDQGNIQTTMLTLPDQDLVTGIVIDKLNSLNIMMAVGAKIYTTTDGGATWTMKSNGLENLVPFHDLILKLAANPLDALQFAIATDQGIFTTIDGGENWTKKLDGLFHNVVFSTDINGHMVAFTHESQYSEFRLQYSNDGGKYWAEVPAADLAYLEASTTAVLFDGENADIYIGSFDLGLVKYTVNINTVGTQNNPIPGNDITVYPNPAKNTITITGADYQTAQIFNLTGQQMITSTTFPVIDISDLQNGIYIVRVVKSNGQVALSRFVKQ